MKTEVSKWRYMDAMMVRHGKGTSSETEEEEGKFVFIHIHYIAER